ncbi:MAG: glycoside hydrolase family 25 protein [Berryella intestinalis]|uniref:glycoside hydrolase family 25 protein n=1 Tax=Berryella intestinalis TaxID=1531429 RepID=UPI002A53014E|nr:glycoside hydrolase family 25 protein [Berryella intestinalis]MDD7369035.1 glycoside hydrolase family 25 protein [Berryella intestinalis]MDY3129695.1 glycoside hydrolase family 25 protein [Berryella intestinalis]
MPAHVFRPVRPRPRREARVRFAIAALSVLAFVFALFNITSCLSSSQVAPQGASVVEGEGAKALSSLPRNQYRWTNLERSEGRLSYTVDGQVLSRMGVDVSSNQGAVDWNAVANDGIEFAYVRLGYRGTATGTMMIDEDFEANLQGAQAAGLDCGVYYFSQAISVEEAHEEAQAVIDQLKGRPLQLPVVFDSETNAAGTGTSRTADLDNEQMSDIALAFCERIAAAGYQSMVYGNASDLQRYDLFRIMRYPLWWAEYDAAVPTTILDFKVWQYTSKGSVKGIPGSVDLNIEMSKVG